MAELQDERVKRRLPPGQPASCRHQLGAGRARASPVLEETEGFVGPDPNEAFHRQRLQGPQRLEDPPHPASHLSGRVDVVRLCVLRESLLREGEKGRVRRLEAGKRRSARGARYPEHKGSRARTIQERISTCGRHCRSGQSQTQVAHFLLTLTFKDLNVKKL